MKASAKSLLKVISGLTRQESYRKLIELLNDEHLDWDKIRIICFVTMNAMACLVSVVYVTLDTLKNRGGWGDFFRLGLSYGVPGYIFFALILIRHYRYGKTIIGLQIFLSIPFIFIRAGTSGGLASPLTAWLMLIPYITQIYLGSLVMLIASTLCLLNIWLWSYPEVLSTLIDHFGETQFFGWQSVAVVCTAIAFTALNALYQCLQQIRLEAIQDHSERLLSNAAALSAVRNTASAVAHQLNSPFSAYLMSIEAIRQEIDAQRPDTDEIENTLLRMEQAVSRMAKINQSLILVTEEIKPEQIEPYTLIHPIHAALDAYKNGAQAEIQFRILSADESVRVTGNAKALAQFLWRSMILWEDQSVPGTDPQATPPGISIEVAVRTHSGRAEISIQYQVSGRELPQEIPRSTLSLAENILAENFSASAELIQKNNIHLKLQTSLS